MIKKCGIYIIRNEANGKVYVGQSSDVTGRLKGHKRLLSRGVHFNPHLQHAFTLYGESFFSFSEVETVNRDMLDSKEIAWISYYNSCNPDFGYNVASGGMSFSHSEETKLKISRAGIGRKLGPPSDSARAKMRAAKLGRKLTEEHKKKISESGKGKPHNWSAQSRASVSRAVSVRNKLKPATRSPSNGRFV